MPSPKSDPLPAVQALRTTFTRIFGNLTAHAAYDHRAATSLVPRALVNNKLIPLNQGLATLIRQSPELAQWADGPPSSTRKLLIVDPHSSLDRVRPRGWHAAETLNQSLPSRLYGRRTVVLQHWCHGRHWLALLPSLIMQLVASPVFDDNPLLRLRNGPPKDEHASLPVAYDLHQLVRRDLGYLLRILHWLVGLLKDATVYCVIDSFDCLEDRLSGQERYQVLASLFRLVRLSCADGDDELADFRLLLMSPRGWDGALRSVGYDDLRRTMMDYGMVFSCAREERSPQPDSPVSTSDVGYETADEFLESTDGSWHTAEEGRAESP